MATRSISQNVNFNTKKLAKGFIDALENAEQSKSKDVVLKKMCVDIKKEQVKEFFKEVE